MWRVKTCVCQVSRCLPADEFFQLCQSVTFQCFSDRVEKSKVVFKVVYHKQDPSQQFFGHQQMVDVRTSVILTAVTGTPSHEWVKVLLVPEKGSYVDIPESEYMNSTTQAIYSAGAQKIVSNITGKCIAGDLLNKIAMWLKLTEHNKPGESFCWIQSS